MNGHLEWVVTLLRGQQRSPRSWDDRPKLRPPRVAKHARDHGQLEVLQYFDFVPATAAPGMAGVAPTHKVGTKVTSYI